MLVIGLVGGIASGKSQVASLFRELGAATIDADREAHAALADPEVLASIREQWGSEVFDEQGLVNRSALGKRVFSSEEERATLEALLHPRVHQRIHDELGRLRQSGCGAAILDVPLLLEVGWRSDCDQVVFIETSESTRLQRALQRGWTEEEWRRREATQMPLADKQRQSTATIENNGDLNRTREQIHELWKQWTQPDHPQ